MKDIRVRVGLLAALDVLAAILIWYTVKLGSTGQYNDWTLYNLSVIGYWDNHAKELIIWGFITAVVFVGFLLYLMFGFDVKNKALFACSIAAGLFLVVGVVLPYQPWAYPVMSNLHIGCSFMAPMSLAIGLIILTRNLYKRGMKSMIPMTVYLVVGLTGAAYLFVKYSIITTTLEVYTITALTTYMTIMALIGLYRYRKSGK